MTGIFINIKLCTFWLIWFAQYYFYLIFSWLIHWFSKDKKSWSHHNLHSRPIFFCFPKLSVKIQRTNSWPIQTLINPPSTLWSWFQTWVLTFNNSKIGLQKPLFLYFGTLLWFSLRQSCKNGLGWLDWRWWVAQRYQNCILPLPTSPLSKMSEKVPTYSVGVPMT